MGPDSDRMSLTHFLAWSSQKTPEVFERGVASDTVDLWPADNSGRTSLHYVASRGILTYSNTFLTGPRFSRSTKWMIMANRSFTMQSAAVK